MAEDVPATVSRDSEISINIKFAKNGIVVSGHRWGPKSSKDVTYVYKTIEEAMTAVPNIVTALKEK